MDEEDLAELREGQKLVDTTEEMDLDYWEKRGKEGDGDDESEFVFFLLSLLEVLNFYSIICSKLNSECS